MHKNDRGDDVNIAVAEKVFNTVRASRRAAQIESDIKTAERSINIANDSIEHDSVRISPSFMEFKDACEGMTFRQPFIIQNMGKHQAHVRICSPNSIAFEIETLYPGVFLSPGLRILRWVRYSYKRNSVLHAMIPIYINQKYIDYHVICTLARASLSIDPISLDFGLVDIGSMSGIKMLMLQNDGGKSTRFAVDLGPNEMDLSVRPMRGILQPHSKILLRVELIGVEEGSFFGEFWIKSTPNIQVPVKVNIIIPRLVVYHPNTTGDFTLIDFPPTFTNTTRHDTIILKSFSAQVSNFIVLGEIDNDLIPINNINLKKHPAFQVFTIYPLEVKLIKDTEDFRNRDRQDFMVFVRIFRVHCTEIEDILKKEVSLDDRAEEPLKKVQLLEPGSVESLAISENESRDPLGYETVRLCLYGEAEEPRLEFVPTEVHLGDVTIGEVVNRELTISNPSKSASVAYNFIPNAAAHCKPSAGKIEPQKSIQVLITVTGNYNVKVPFKLAFDIVVKTCDLTNLKVLYIKAKPCWILGWFKLIIPLAKDKRRKHSSGITSSLEIGTETFITEAVFKSIPTKNLGAVLCVKDNDLWKDLVDKKLLIANKLRDYPLNLGHEYALPPKQAAFRSYHRLYWANYLRMRRTQNKAPALKNSTAALNDATDCTDLLTAKLPEIKEQSIAQKMFSKAMALKVVKKAKDEMLVPLSPLQIYNVKIAPTVLAYGLVAPKSTNYRTLHIENLNDFPVMLRLVSRVSKSISFLNGSLIVIHPGEQITKTVEYRAQRVGKYNTYIDYVINDNHSFAMTITANVVVKSLNLNVRELTFGKNYLPQEAYQPLATFVEVRNKLDATTSFTWDLRSDANFVIYPMSGEVRGNRTLFAEVCYEPIAAKSNNTEVVLTSESGNWANLKLDVILKKPDVAFINDTLNLDKIPLNLTTTAIGILHNAEFTEVIFQIDSLSLIYGCEVYPHHGVIPPRGIVNLEVRLRFDACFKFSIKIHVMVQKNLKLELKLLGQVSYPMLKLCPETISMKRISTDAISTHLLTLSNIGKTVLKVQFLLEEYPEYCVSLSPRRSDPGIDSDGLTILPNAFILLYLHFIPIDLASYSFYLPIVINEILGPVLIEHPKSIKPSDFLKPRETFYVHSPGIEISEFPSTMPTVFIDYTVSGHVISFSKHIFHFDVLTNKVKDKLRVFNETRQEVSFIIRIDEFSEPKSPFSITWLSGVKPAVTHLSIVCTLEPREEIIFLIEFKPVEQGNFKIEAPIFVRGELEGDMFSSLLLDGLNLVSCITCDKTELYFAPVPLAVEAEQKITLKVGRCLNPIKIEAIVVKPTKFVGTYSDNCIQVKFLGSNFVTGKNSNEEMEISVLFQSKFPVAFVTTIEFYIVDTLVCSVSVCVTADNCILSTYGFLQGTIEFDIMAKRPERISFPSISSRGEGSSSLMRQELIIPQKHGDMLLTRLSLHPSVSGVSNKSIKTPGAKSKVDQNEDERSEYNNEDDNDEASIQSKVSDALPPVSDQYYKLFNTVYPYFPMTVKANDIDNHMQRTLNATEQWMYSGGFKFNFYPSIVDGITAVLSGVCSTTLGGSERQKAHTVNQSFIDLLVSLAGSDILKYIGDTSRIPEDPVERVSYVLKLYDNALEFLAVQGAFLPHVQSQFLLSYNDYLINNIRNEYLTQNYSSSETEDLMLREKMCKELFQSRSKQCWLDVGLQTFKTLVLRRISLKNLQDNTNNSYSQHDSSSNSSASSAVSVLEYVARKTSTEQNAKNTDQNIIEETLLLSWLQRHFEQQQLEGWMKDDRIYLNPNEKRDVLKSKTILNFESDLADSLVLIAVTAAHCPYLIDDHFKNIFISPRNVEEIHHNAMCLTTAWRRIRLGFIITPGQITRPNCVQMLMLVTHLFNSLPSFIPTTKIQFCCPLTETATRQISFSNTTEFPVSYIVEFIGNVMELFTAVLPQSIVNLEARNTGSLKVRYHARKIAKTKAYIILCGSSVAPRFTRNHVFILEGCTSYLGITHNYEIERMLYKVCNETLNIPVPYKEATEYNISFTEEEPTVPASLKLSRWADLKSRKVPRRLFLNQKTLFVSENTYQADLSITITCIAPTKRSFWIVFESEIGDFIIQINSASTKSTTDYISVEWERETCTCSDLSNGISSTCPLNIKVSIPARNVQLWSCINEMFQKTLDPKERSFWSRHFDTNIGLRLIHWLMGDYHDAAAKEFMHIFNTSVTYDVTTTDKDNLIIPAKFSIHDVRPRDVEICMPVHILQTTSQAYEATIILSSPDKMEYRIYKTDFLCRTPIPCAAISATDSLIKNKTKRKR